MGARAAILWFSMPQLSHLDRHWIPRLSPGRFRDDLRDVGLQRAMLRAVKAVASLMMQCVYCIYSFAALGLAVRSVRARDPWGSAVAIGTLFYTLISAHFALGETAPFFFLLYALPGTFCKQREMP